MNKKYLFLLVILSMIMGISAPALADDDDDDDKGRNGPKIYTMGTSTGTGGDKKDMRLARPEVVGKVASVSSTTLTVVGKASPKGGATTTYTVDASNAVIIKGNATSTLSNVAVGDLVIVQGTINGTNVTAKIIRDAALRNPKASPKPGALQGNGQPVIGGIVTSLNGTSFVLTNSVASSTSYTVDAANAKILIKGKLASSTADIKVGDRVIVQGAINGTSVTASSVVDQGPKPEAGDKDKKNGDKEDDKKDDDRGGKKKGFFGGVGDWFKRLFGF